MKRIAYILLALTLALTSCVRDVIDLPGIVETAPEGQKVELSFKIAVPNDGPSTRALADEPEIDNVVIAVFGGSGFFNEWVVATIESADETNYDGTSATEYTISAQLTVSTNLLRLHFIGNCPAAFLTSPPVSSGADKEEDVLSRIRTQYSDAHPDGYWQKVMLPRGVQAEKDSSNVWVPTAATLAQFSTPIPLVRNFARVYLRNLTSGDDAVTIHRYAIAYAPSEGTIAPMLQNPYITDEYGHPFDTTGTSPSTKIYYESFLSNYQRYPIESSDPSDTTLVGRPFFYGGYSPADQAYGIYPGNADPNVPEVGNLTNWDSTDIRNNVLYVYERTIPTVSKKATRIIIDATRNNDTRKYYALDIVDSAGVAVPLLRNQTYTVRLLGIDPGAGETDLAAAANATSASVTGGTAHQELPNISDGSSSIAASFTEKFYVSPQIDSVMFRYIPTNVGENANKEDLDLVSIKIGTKNEDTGVFTEVSAQDAATQSLLAFKTATVGGNLTYKVWIDTLANGTVIPYVRGDNRWVPATQAQIADAAVEKWGMIKYELNDALADSETNYFVRERFQAIQVIGSYEGKVLSRDVLIKLSPRQDIKVVCLDKYIPYASGESEVVRIYIPNNLSRSVFPLDFRIEPDGYSLTPNGDVLPVTYGASIAPGVSRPTYYFVRSLTQAEFNTLPDETDALGVKWKYFDCHFKTTIANNACTVWVENHYFDDEDAHDTFYNYIQRQFTNGAFSPNTVHRGESISFSFVMDSAHSGTIVWWDPQNELGMSANATEATEKGLSTSNRVLPPIVKLTFTGFEPQTGSNATAGLVYENGSYHYYVTTGTGNTLVSADAGPRTLKLIANGAVGSSANVTLSTRNIESHPTLYADYTSSSVTILASTFSNVGFTETSIPIGLPATAHFHFTYQSNTIHPVTITLGGLRPAAGETRITGGAGGVYTFTPTDADISANTLTYTITLEATSETSDCYADLANEYYSAVARSTLTRQKHQFTNLTYEVNNLAVNNLALGLNQTTTFRFDYEPGFACPVTITMVGLEPVPGDDARISGSNGTYTFTPSAADIASANGRIATFRVRSTTRFSAGTITLSADGYDSNSKTLNRSGTSFTIPQNAIYIRGTGTGNPSNLSTGNSGTYVEIYPTNSYTNRITRSRYSSSYLNNSDQAITLSSFSNYTDDTVVYFRYYASRTYYYATATLAELYDATTSNRVTLHFGTTAP